MALKIRTNRVPRFIVESHELTKPEREEFDYLDWNAIDEGLDGATFVRYQGELIDLGTFERRDVGGTGYWHGIRCDSAWGGVVIRLADDGETAILGRASS